MSIITKKNIDSMDKKGVINFFNNTFGEYDKWIGKVVPGYDKLQTGIISYIKEYFTDLDKISILELGVGSGTTSKELLSNFKNAKVHGLENSIPMISMAKNKLDKYKNRFSIDESDFTKYKLKKKYDVIVSSLSIHHYELNEMKDIFSRIKDSLKPGGVFINADIIKYQDENLSNEANEDYIKFLKTNLDDDIAVLALEKHIELQDKPQPIEDIIGILIKTKFMDIRIPYRQGSFAIYGGRNE